MSIELFSLAGKRALVTGGVQGLGRMISEGLLRAGAAVCVTSRQEEAVAAAVAEMSALGDCTGLTADLSRPEGAVRCAAAYRERIAGLDILVNNAGKSWGAPIDSFPDKAWPSVMSINVQAPFTLLREFLHELDTSGTVDDPARVVNIGSAAGSACEPIQAYSYSASKAGIQHLSRQLAADLAPRHINVNALVPGYFPSKMTGHMIEADGTPDAKLVGGIPAKRLGRPDDVAGAVIFLCSRAGAYVTGIELPLDGGLVGCR